MSRYEFVLMSLLWQALNVQRMATKHLDFFRKECRQRFATASELATLRDELAKMALNREEIERWLEDFDDEVFDLEEHDEDRPCSPRLTQDVEGPSRGKTRSSSERG